jgi:hypothetical protein
MKKIVSVYIITSSNHNLRNPKVTFIGAAGSIMEATSMRDQKKAELEKMYNLDRSRMTVDMSTVEVEVDLDGDNHG